MATNDQVSQEYILIKCFLYKYTPPFTKVKLGSAVSSDSSLSTFTPYSIPLDDTHYFTKYDISQFVTDYTFEQNINETTYSWSVTLQDLALSYGTINSKLKVVPPAGSSVTGGLAFSNANSSNSVALLAEYESNANTFENNDASLDTSGNPILNAKFKRGLTPAPLTAQNTNLTTVLSTIPGLRLSDMIQEYDFISVFLYKNTTPLTDIYGVFTVDDSLDNNPLQIFNYKITSNTTPAFQNYQNPVDPYLKYESVLLTKMPNGNTLFSNEFNGFVMKKNTTSSIAQVDRLTISGNGWSRLFGATRRTIKTSVFANALYQAGQVTGLNDVTPFSGIYAGQPIAAIIQDLFDTVYKIDFNTTTSEKIAAASVPINHLNSTNLATSTLVQSDFFASPLGTGTTPSSSFAVPTLPPLGTSFYNITSLIVANDYPANIFTLPPYLLSTVMKFRPFAYIEPINMPASADFIHGAKSAASSLAGPNNADEILPSTFQQAIQAYDNGQQTLNYGSTSPVFIDPTVQNLRAYFRFLDAVFLSFNPDLQTPYEVLDHIRKITFTEIYEQPGGQFIIRAPQYNNFATSVTGRPDIALIRSNNLNIISSNYSSTVENLVSKILTGYSPDFTPISTVQQFGYCDGKLLIQDGQLEMETEANPNTSTASISDASINNSKTTGIFGWAEYLMELANARLKTGTIMCNLDNTIQVGNTFIDETKYKFGYVISVSKRVSVAGTASMTLALSYVRDAVPLYNTDQSIKDINTDLLPVLTNIEDSFAGL